MANYNLVILVGNLTRPVELKYTDAGMAIANMGMAINKKRKDSEKTCFVDLTAFGKTAETMAQYLEKGSPILVEGELDYQQWEKDGEKRNKLAVIVNNFQFIGKVDKGEA